MDPLKELKGFDAGHQLALIKKIGGRDLVDAILRDEKTIVVKDAVRTLLDKHGLCISSVLDITSQVENENKSFCAGQPEINYRDILSWYKEIFPKGTKFIEASKFEDLAEFSREKILQNHQISNLFQRAHMPVPFPKYQIDDSGTALQDFYLPAVERSYNLKFPNKKFNNYMDGKLEKQVSILPNFGNNKFLAKMATGGFFWFFAHPLQGFCINAQREAMGVLTQYELGLSGTIVNSLATAGFPSELVGSFNTPGMFCSGDFWGSSDYSLYFDANDDFLIFGCTGILAHPNEVLSGGLFFFG